MIDKVIISNFFFIIGIVLLILACLMRLISWSIHKRYALEKINANQKDIEKAKLVLKQLFNYLAIIGFLSTVLSLVFAFI